MENEEQLLQRITVIPGLMSGKPTIRGMRFPVADILGYLASGMTDEDVLDDFPYLEKEDIQAAFLYVSKKINYPVLTVCIND